MKQLTLDRFLVSTKSPTKRKAEEINNEPETKISRGFHFIPSPQPSRGVLGKNVDCAKEFTAELWDYTKIDRLLTENGFVIVKDVLNAEECREIIDGVWDSMEEITSNLEIPLDRNDPKTWKSMKKQANIRNMYKYHGIVHAEFMWKLRQHPNVLNIFSKIYKCQPQNLLASYDGLSMQTPPEYSKTGWFRSCWYHVDQSYARPQRECFQGWVTARDIDPGDYTTGFFVGSHKSFKEFGERFGVTNKEDFNKLKTKEQMEFYESRHDQIRVTCPAGSLVVWDSRLLHSGLEPLKGRKNPHYRTICFLSYGPRFNVSNHILKKRQNLYKNRRATSHWSHMNLRTIPEKTPPDPRIKKLESKPLETATLRKLVGY